MKQNIKLLLFGSLLLPLAGQVRAGDWTAGLFFGDADSGINSGLTYTAKADFNGGGASINGVSFTDTGFSGAGYALTGGLTGHAGNPNGLAGNISNPARNFFYTNDASGNATLTLTGLTPGENYVSTWNNTNWGGSRFVDITPSDTGTPFRIHEDGNSAGAGGIIRYAFTATGSTQTYSFDAVSNNDSFHHYVFSNAVRNDAVLSYTHFTPVTPSALITNVSGNGSPFAVNSSDLLQTSLSGVTTTGNFNREGTLGAISVLTNGNFSITGIAQNNPELVTSENNSSLTYTLDTSVNTLGYDITNVDGYGGWNDGGRDQVSYSVYFSLVGSTDWTLYGQVSENPASPTGISAVKASLSGLVSGVDAIRFDFQNGLENGFTGLGELDVIGTATIPEPSSMALMIVGLLGLARRKRR